MTGSRPRHLIKKYANRKLYDTTTSRYITLEGISQLVRSGHDIEVTDRTSGRDLTPLILSQLVMTAEKHGEERNQSVVSEGIHDRGQALLDYVRRSLVVPALVTEGVGRRREELEAVIDRALENALNRLSIPTLKDLHGIERSLDELAAKVDQMRAEASEFKTGRKRSASPKQRLKS
ncbi:MAG TPA: polyhydroxyalkanoate synthesis regulator DNA-binding domain-containing protein [Candidatus Dormibacteraeota bacterium]|jgi:polyhydroxyalkanoate synthesis repressor PhaR|nr:polyhydroxyalkanoate synthesis regulator DNA-binding domain-containing protein [Candidatus Dormibacteraeota bacterium]